MVLAHFPHHGRGNHADRYPAGALVHAHLASTTHHGSFALVDGAKNGTP
jgi:hypothetical protein